MSIYAGIVIELSGVIIALLGIMYQLSRIADDLATGEEAAEQEQNKAADVAEPTDVRSETPTQRLGTPPLRNEPVAPDRAEELARKIADYFSRSATFRNLMPGEVDDVASLLRREMGRWIPVSERLPDTNEAGVSSVFFWVTSEDGWQFGYYRKDAEGECWESERSDAYNEPYTYSTEQVSYWLPESALPAPPREEG